MGPVPHTKPSLQVKPTVLIGLAGAGKLFTEEVLTTMGEHNERPIIMYAFLVPYTVLPSQLACHLCLPSELMLAKHWRVTVHTAASEHRVTELSFVQANEQPHTPHGVQCGGGSEGHRGQDHLCKRKSLQ